MIRKLVIFCVYHVLLWFNFLVMTQVIVFDAVTITEVPSISAKGLQLNNNYVCDADECEALSKEVELLKQFQIDLMGTITAFVEFKSKMTKSFKTIPVIFMDNDGAPSVGEVETAQYDTALELSKKGIRGKVTVFTFEGNSISFPFADTSEVTNPVLYDLYLFLKNQCVGGKGRFAQLSSQTVYAFHTLHFCSIIFSQFKPHLELDQLQSSNAWTRSIKSTVNCKRKVVFSR